MKAGGIRIDKISLRMRGVRPREAERRAGDIAREIARSLSAPGALPAGQTEIPSMTLRVKADGSPSRK